ncbi:MAG: PAS domain S-box protein [Gemmatimonadales bacterium]
MPPRGEAGAGAGPGRRNTPPSRRALDVLQSAPEALQAVFENSPDVVMIIDRERRIQYINRYFPPFEPGRVLGADAALFTSPENRPSMTAALERVFREGVPDRYELTGPGPEGTLVSFESRVVPIIRDGSVAAALVTSVDVTERRRAERTQMATFRISAAAHTAPTLGELYEAIHRIVGELMPARNFYIALYDAQADLISFPYFVDEYDPPFPPKKPGRGVTEYVLRSGQSLLLTPELAEDLTRRGEVELIGAPSIDWLGVPLTIRGATIGALVVQSYVEHVRYGEAEQRILEFVSSQVAMAVQHKRAEEALRESEMTLKSIVDAIPETALLVNLDFTIAAANRAVLDGDPRSPDELVGQLAFQVSAADLSDQRRSRVEEVIRTGQPVRWEDTSAITGRTHINFVHPVRDAAGKVARIAVFALDITERKRAEEALRRSEEQYRTLVDGARDVIFALSPDGICTALNPAFESITGWTRDEWLGRPFAELLHPEDVIAAYDLFARVLRREARATAQLRFRTRSGEFLVGEVYANLHQQDGVILGALGIARDVTDRVRLEEQLRQAQKMEAVGRLAGGVAHDFNNLLTAIGGYSDLLLADLATADPRRGDVEEIKKAAERAAALTRQLLAFSRRQVLQPKVLDLNGVIAGAEKLLRRLIGEQIRLETRLAAGLGAVRADAGQVEQVVMNLAVNARDAMREGGTLTVETANVQIGTERRTAEQAPMPATRCARAAR